MSAVVDRARAMADGVEGPPAQARARACTRSRRWLLLHATRLGGAAEGQTAVIVEPARPAEVAPLILRAYGRSVREREVTQSGSGPR